MPRTITHKVVYKFIVNVSIDPVKRPPTKSIPALIKSALEDQPGVIAVEVKHA